MDPQTRHRSRELGPVTGPPMNVALGFGCDQATWTPVAERVADETDQAIRASV